MGANHQRRGSEAVYLHRIHGAQRAVQSERPASAAHSARQVFRGLIKVTFRVFSVFRVPRIVLAGVPRTQIREPETAA
jgi:hypothetical protein